MSLRQIEPVNVHWIEPTKDRVQCRTSVVAELTVGVSLPVKCINGYTVRMLKPGIYVDM